MKRRKVLRGFAVLGLAPWMPVATLGATKSEPRVLVAVFSRWRDMPKGADTVSHATPAVGHTAALGEAMAKAIGAEFLEIETTQTYSVDHRENSRQAKAELDVEARPALKKEIDVSRADVVFIGFPVWWYREPMVIRTFVESCDWKGKVVVPFCTSMSVGIEEAEGDLTRLCRGARVVPGRRFATGRGEGAEEAADWAREVWESLKKENAS